MLHCAVGLSMKITIKYQCISYTLMHVIGHIRGDTLVQLARPVQKISNLIFIFGTQLQLSGKSEAKCDSRPYCAYMLFLNLTPCRQYKILL